MFQRFSGSTPLPPAPTVCYTPACLAAAGAGYTLPDPTGTSLVMTKANGDEVGRVLYDGYGAVLTSTLPATLTTTLAGSGDVPDPDTGLVYLGAGRWYDPALGRPLQPNPVGGPPTVPQALNRYAATAWGPPGMAEGAASNAFNWTPHAIGFIKNLSVELAGQASIVTGYRYAGQAIIEVTASQSALARRIPKGLRQSFDEAVFAFAEGDRRFYARRGVFTLKGSSLSGLESQADDLIVGLREALPSRKPWAATLALKELNMADPMPIHRTLDDFSIFKAFKTGAAFTLDFGFGYGFQLYEDTQNPYLTPSGRQIRAIISGSGGAASAAVVVAIAVQLGLCPEKGGATCLAAAGTVGGLIWSSLQQPFLYWLEPRVSPYGFHVIPVRNLKPLEE